MMKHIKKEKKKQSLSTHQKIRGAGFVSTEEENTQTFKYNSLFSPSRYVNEKFIALKNTCNKTKQTIQLKLNKFDFVLAGSATSVWLINAFIEGFIVNFSVWGLLGWRFNFITIMAWGFVVKNLLGLYWRLKTNGADTKLPQKHE